LQGTNFSLPGDFGRYLVTPRSRLAFFDQPCYANLHAALLRPVPGRAAGFFVSKARFAFPLAEILDGPFVRKLRRPDKPGDDDSEKS
jgi:hypothetical protein